MPPKSKKDKPTGRGGGKGERGGRVPRSNGHDGGNNRASGTTIFKTNSIGVDAGNATSASITMEVENRSGEGYPAQTLLKMFYNEDARKKLIGFLREQEPIAMQRGWSQQSQTDDSSSSNMFTLLSQMAMAGTSGTPNVITPALLQSLQALVSGGSTPAPAFTMSAPAPAPTPNREGSLLLAPASAGNANDERSYTMSQWQAIQTHNNTFGSAGFSGSHALPPAPAPASQSPGGFTPTTTATVSSIAKMLVAKTISMPDAKEMAEYAKIAFSRVIQSFQIRVDRAQNASGGGSAPGNGPGRQNQHQQQLSSLGRGSSTRANRKRTLSNAFNSPTGSTASGAESEYEASYNGAGQGHSFGMSDVDTDNEDNGEEEQGGAHAPLDMASPDAQGSASDAAAGTTPLTPADQGTSAAIAAALARSNAKRELAIQDACIRRHFFRKNGTEIARSKVRTFCTKFAQAMRAQRFTVPDIPKNADLPERDFIAYARVCVRYMFAAEPHTRLEYAVTAATPGTSSSRRTRSRNAPPVETQSFTFGSDETPTALGQRVRLIRERNAVGTQQGTASDESAAAGTSDTGNRQSAKTTLSFGPSDTAAANLHLNGSLPPLQQASALPGGDAASGQVSAAGYERIPALPRASWSTAAGSGKRSADAAGFAPAPAPAPIVTTFLQPGAVTPTMTVTLPPSLPTAIATAYIRPATIEEQNVSQTQALARASAASLSRMGLLAAGATTAFGASSALDSGLAATTSSLDGNTRECMDM
jgi:hypothetical protein